MELTSQQAISCALKETTFASYPVLMKEKVSVVPVKQITDPTPLQLKETSWYSVRWSRNDKRIYRTILFAMGESNLSP